MSEDITVNPVQAGPGPDPRASGALAATVAEQGSARHKDFLVRWCIALAIVAVAIGMVLPYLVDSPVYPHLPPAPHAAPSR